MKTENEYTIKSAVKISLVLMLVFWVFFCTGTRALATEEGLDFSDMTGLEQGVNSEGSYTEDWYRTYDTFTNNDGETIQLCVSDYGDGSNGIDVDIDGVNAATIFFDEPEQMEDGAYLYSNGGMQWIKYYPDENEVQINFADGRGILTYEYSSAEMSADGVSSSNVGFTENWYETYNYFESGDGYTLEIEPTDTEDVYLSFIVNDTNYLSCLADSYEIESDGSYKYSSEIGNACAWYYPEEGNYIKFYMDWSDTSINFYLAEKPEIIGYYLTDTVGTSNFRVYAQYAYRDYVGDDYLYIYVHCFITSISEEEQTFIASELFELNNNGILDTGLSEHDYTRMAPWAQIETNVYFIANRNGNTNFDLMTLTIDGVEMSLSDKPQTAEDWYDVPGIYNRYDDDGYLVSKMFLFRQYGNVYTCVEINYSKWAMHLIEINTIEFDETGNGKVEDSYAEFYYDSYEGTIEKPTSSGNTWVWSKKPLYQG